jgi:Flp pilus assembly protein TadD
MDRWQYLEDWPSGSRLRDVAAFLKRVAAHHETIVVLRDQRSGPVLEGLNLALRRHRGSIEFVDVNIRKGRLPAAVRGLRESGRPVLLAAEQPPAHPLMLSLDGASLARPLGFFLKPKGLRQIEVYCILGACAADEDAALQPAGAAAGPKVEPPTKAPTGRDVDSPGALEELRVCAVEAGGESLAACRHALASGLSWPRAAEAHYSMGRNLTTFGRYEEALAAFREASRLLPDDVDQTLALAETLEAFAHHEEALANARDALRLAPDAPAVHHRIGYNLAWLGRLAEAEAALRRALALDAAQVGVHNDLAVVLWLEGKRDEAVAELREALGIDDEAVRTRYNMGVLQASVAASPHPHGGQTQSVGPRSIR